MADQLKAKLKVYQNTPANLDANGDKHGEQVVLSAVYANEPGSENYSYSQATPSAQLSMYISNPDAFGFFEPGKEYIFTITPATES